MGPDESKKTKKNISFNHKKEGGKEGRKEGRKESYSPVQHPGPRSP